MSVDENATASGARMLPNHLQAPLLHAGFWRRVGAYLIDGLLLGAAAGVLYAIVLLAVVLPAGTTHHGAAADIHMFVAIVALDLVFLAISWLYFALMESSRLQATVGKLALGLRVTDLSGRRIGFGRASGRFFGKILSGMIFDIGYMMAGWTARKQALHDLLADCCVVRKEGLALFERGDQAGSTARAPAGMPGWAIALIVVAACFFLVVPVVAILAAIAIPAYQNYTVRTEVSQGIALSERPRALVAEYIGARGALPGSNTDLGLPQPDAIHASYVTSVRIVDGKVVVTYGNHANAMIRGGHVVFSPVGNAALLHWQCSSPDIRDRYLPSTCRR